jgi:hypothetical protein
VGLKINIEDYLPIIARYISLVQDLNQKCMKNLKIKEILIQVAISLPCVIVLVVSITSKFI